jgi:hypothetical protein
VAEADGDVETATGGPWTIKWVAIGVRQTVVRAAQIEGVSVGMWLEKRVREWQGNGSPVPVMPSDDEGALTRAIELIGKLAAAGDAVPPDIAAWAYRAVRSQYRIHHRRRLALSSARPGGETGSETRFPPRVSHGGA